MIEIRVADLETITCWQRFLLDIRNCAKIALKRQAMKLKLNVEEKAMLNIIMQLGFEDMQEFNRMVASVPLNSEQDAIAFKKWQESDGSKAGLLAIIQKKTKTAGEDK